MTKLYLPSLRGKIGEWIYYPCIMTMRDLSQKVDYAHDIHQSKQLSELLQRSLDEGKRGKDIASYLCNQRERFFNSLVVAVYQGDPVWIELSDVSPGPNVDLEGLPDKTIESVGILRLSGKEKLFALDGQHRLAGIKRAIGENEQLAEEQVSVILLAHKSTKAGMRRTRRLFTTLNKTAERVSKADTIALDEDDVMAICVRDLVENNDWFGEGRISSSASNNIPPSERQSLTTLGNLYDVLFIIFKRVLKTHKTRELKYYRPPDEALDTYLRYTKTLFVAISKTIKPLGEYFHATDIGSVVDRYRHGNGGCVWFRPVGLKLMAELIAELVEKEFEVLESLECISKLPDQLDEPPFEGVLWDSSLKRVLTANSVLARRLMLYMLGEKKNVAKLKDDYNRALKRDMGDALRSLRKIAEERGCYCL